MWLLKPFWKLGMASKRFQEFFANIAPGTETLAHDCPKQRQNADQTPVIQTHSPASISEALPRFFALHNSALHCTFPFFYCLRG
jgi:hypothetical protein